jgi:hypothetical protein
MPNTFTSNVFSSTYKDDFVDSDNYHRILFNSGRALQARELTQLQTIIQEEIARFGRNIFTEGAAVNPGGPSITSDYEFIKLNTATNVLPADTDTLLNTEFTGQSSAIKARVIEVVAAEGSDPATLYVQYTNTSGGTLGSTPIRMSAAEDISNGTVTLTVQSTNTVANPAIGQGCKISSAAGDFFTRGHFVFSPPQGLILSKYTRFPSAVVGFKTTEDIVTVSDDQALYDNQGATPNLSSPGADRYRIKMELTTEDLITGDDNFVYYCDVVEGNIVDQVTGADNFAAPNELVAKRTFEESGNYIAQDFTVNLVDSGENIGANVSDGVAYINGYRAHAEQPTALVIPKPRTTTTFENQVAGITYGQYLICGTLEGKLDVSTFETLNLRSAINHGGSTIGTARVRYVEEDGANFRVYIFDIRMNSGQVFRDVKSLGTSTTDFANPILESGKAAIKEAGKNNLVYPLPRSRPRSITDVDFEVQRLFTGTTNGAGSLTLSLSASGETFSNTGQWIVTVDSSGDVVSAGSPTGAGTASTTISGLPTSSAVTVYTKVNKGSPSVRQKTLVETTYNNTGIESDGTGTKFVNLHATDVALVFTIKQTDSDGEDLSHLFTVDNGQRAGYYDNARLILAGDATPPSGGIFCRFMHFTHGAGDYFSVNSYTGQTEYEFIPSFQTGPRSAVNLRDVIDFRSSVDSDGLFSGSGAAVNEVPSTGDIFQGDIEYYLPRSDKIVINQAGEVKNILGQPGFSSQIPPTPENTLPLFELEHNAYGLHDSDTVVTPILAKRFTMKDISQLEERIDKLEEVTSLSLLEVETSTLLVLDSDGNNRVKSGFFVDNFKDRGFSDVENKEYRAGIEPAKGFLSTPTFEDNVALVYDSDASSNTILKGDTVFLNYDHKVAIKQTKVSGVENLNPFAVITGEGKITLSPASDEWIQTKYKPLNVVSRSQTDTLSDLNEGTLADGTAAKRGFQELENRWVWTDGPWVPVEGYGKPSFAVAGLAGVADVNPGNEMGQGGLPGLLGGRGSYGIGSGGGAGYHPYAHPEVGDDMSHGYGGYRAPGTWNWHGNDQQRTSNGINQSNVAISRQGEYTYATRKFSQQIVTGDRTIRKVVGDKSVSLTFLPFIRSRLISFRAEGLKPNTQFFPFFDGKDVSAFCREEAFTRYASRRGQSGYVGNAFRKSLEHPDGKSDLVSNANGEITGSFFIPSGQARRFRAGTRTFKLLDINRDNEAATLSRASANYTAQGVLDTRQKTVTSTRVVEVRTRRWTETTKVKNRDPLAQSFTVTKPSGMYVTKVQAYFKKKDDIVPVELQIRPMVNGAPSATEVIANASKFLNPSSVNLPASQTQAAVLAAPTTFEFDEPIFLNPDTDYCIVLLTDCNNYEAYVAETYSFELGSTEKRISRQPSLGSLFKSQNGKTWEPDQTKDLAFQIFQAEFDTTGGYAVFENGELEKNDCNRNPFYVKNADATITLTMPNHGYDVGDTVTITGLDSAETYNGMLGTSILGDRTVTEIDAFGLRFEADSASTSAGRFGGDGVVADRQIQFDTMIPNFTTLLPDDTTISYSAKFTTGKSLAAITGGQIRYQKDADYSSEIVVGGENYFSAPRLVAKAANETANLGAGVKSTSFKIDMNTTSSDVSPIVDGQRASITTINNVIDNQAAAPASGFNVPLTFTDETVSFGGSAAAKHITSVIRLEEDAIGLKVILSAVRPNGADFDLYYRVANDGEDIFTTDYVLQTAENTVAPDGFNFRDYRYLIGGAEGFTDQAFTQYQLKIVMRSNNSSAVPIFKDLRAIALAV